MKALRVVVLNELSFRPTLTVLQSNTVVKILTEKNRLPLPRRTRYRSSV